MDEKTSISPNIMNSLWRFLASLKLTVVLLLCMAVLSIIGTVVPQHSSPQEYVTFYGLFAYQVFVLLDIVDMYHSWWFVGLMLLLVVNIVVCSIERLQSSAKVIFTRKPSFDLQKYRQRKGRNEFTSDTPAERLKAPFERVLRRRFRYCQPMPTEKGFAFTAEKGRWTRLGVYVVHLSIVVLLFGGLIGSKFGFEGFVNIPEGESADTIQSNRSGQRLTLPFSIRCDDFSLQFYEGGQRPKEYRSSLTILEEGKEVVRKDIVVNDPLTYKGIGIYQSSYGRMAPATAPVALDTEVPDEQISLSFRSAASGMIYPGTTKLGEPLQIPEGLGQLVLNRFEPEARFKGMDLGPAYEGTLTNREGVSESVILPLKFPKFDNMRGGDVAIAVDQRQAPVQQRFYTGLQVVSDPGVGFVYAGFILMIAGCIVAFFMSHQQVVVEVTTKGSSSRIMVSGKANKNQAGFQMTLQRLADRLAVLAEDRSAR
jgi:cytochrome c biogenesis protein